MDLKTGLGDCEVGWACRIKWSSKGLSSIWDLPTQHNRNRATESEGTSRKKSCARNRIAEAARDSIIFHSGENVSKPPTG